MRHSSREKKYFFISIFFHLAILSIFILGFERLEPLAVFENTNQHDVISAVLLGDTAKSHIMPLNPSKPTPPPVKEIIKDIAKPKPVITKTEPDAIALAIDKKKQRAEMDKALAEKMRKQISNKNLLLDIEKETKKQKNITQKELQKNFQKTLQAQAEKTLRQQLLDDDIKIRATENRMSQGEVNKYKALMMQAISEHWVIPNNADKKLVTHLLVRLERGGAVLDVQITRSSGDTALDSSARAAVLKASPLPVPKDAKAFEPFRQFVLKAKPQSVLKGDLS